MAPGARHFTKRWLPEITRAGFAGCTPISAGERCWPWTDERDICAEILAAAGADCTENIAGELSLTETFGVDQPNAVVHQQRFRIDARRRVALLCRKSPFSAPPPAS